MVPVELYTDGSCYPNPGPNGGWASILLMPNNIVFVIGRSVPGVGSILREGVYETTNNRMELLGILMGLKILPAEADVLVKSDSQYSINTITRRKNSNTNHDLIQACQYEVERLSSVSFQYVRGHKGDLLNELADKLAGSGVKALPGPGIWNGRRTHAIVYDENLIGDFQTVWYDYDVCVSFS